MLFVHRQVLWRMVRVCTIIFCFVFLVCHKIASDKGVYLTCPLNFIGFLISLLKHLTYHHARAMSRDADTQTNWTANYGESLGTTKLYFIHLNIPHLCLIISLFDVALFVSIVEKMKSIDKEYENLGVTGEKWSSMESKLAAYRKEIEAQAQAEMNTKVFFPRISSKASCWLL